jgi:hypothetical protein
VFNEQDRQTEAIAYLLDQLHQVFLFRRVHAGCRFIE